MNIQMVRAKVKAEYVGEAETAGKRIFEALEREQPQGIRYTVCRLPDGVTYVMVLAYDSGGDKPLLAFPEGREFEGGEKQWLAEPPISEQLTVVGSYRVF
jgi:hypothetical protein